MAELISSYRIRSRRSEGNHVSVTDGLYIPCEATGMDDPLEDDIYATPEDKVRHPEPRERLQESKPDSGKHGRTNMGIIRVAVTQAIGTSVSLMQLMDPKYCHVDGRHLPGC